MSHLINEKNKTKLPLIKESRVEKILAALKCFKQYPYNRDAARDCILSHYPGKDEKSVFRGMLIPSLRYLGLIVGFEELIRLSSNGNLIVESNNISFNEGLRTFRVILIEFDDNFYYFLKKLEILIRRNKNLWADKKKFIAAMANRVEAPSMKQAVERVRHWLALLEGVDLIQTKKIKEVHKKMIFLKKTLLIEAKKDLNPYSKRRNFRKELFSEYRRLVMKEKSLVVDIEDLRAEVSRSFYKDSGLILTEMQFDHLLRFIPQVTRSYAISLGKPMGAEEKLFKYRGSYYRTLSIRFFDNRGM